MAEREAVICGHIACAEARSAEGGLYDGARAQELFGGAYSCKLKAYRNACRIYGQAEVAVACRTIVKYFRGFYNVIKKSAGTTGNDALIGKHAAVALHFRHKIDVYLAAERLTSLRLYARKNILRVRKEFLNRISVARMERYSYHRLYRGKVDANHAVIICAFARPQLFIIAFSAVRLEVIAHLIVSLPYGAEARCLGGHYIDAVSEIYIKIRNAGTCKLEHLVLNAARFERRAYERYCNIVRTYAAFGGIFEIYEHHLGRVYIVCVGKELLNKLSAAFAYAHRSERAIACVAVRAEYHLAAARHHFAGIGVYDALVCGNIYSAVTLSRRKAEHMVILIYRSAYGAKAVVAVRHGVRYRELLEAARACRLDYAYICDIVRYKLIKLYLKLFSVSRRIMGVKY